MKRVHQQQNRADRDDAAEDERLAPLPDVDPLDEARYQREPVRDVVHSRLEALHVLPLARQVLLGLHRDANLVVDHRAGTEKFEGNLVI